MGKRLERAGCTRRSETENMTSDGLCNHGCRENAAAFARASGSPQRVQQYIDGNSLHCGHELAVQREGNIALYSS